MEWKFQTSKTCIASFFSWLTAIYHGLGGGSLALLRQSQLLLYSSNDVADKFRGWQALCEPDAWILPSLSQVFFHSIFYKWYPTLVRFQRFADNIFFHLDRVLPCSSEADFELLSRGKVQSHFFNLH
jgi:hypothetical protein